MKFRRLAGLLAMALFVQCVAPMQTYAADGAPDEYTTELSAEEGLEASDTIILDDTQTISPGSEDASGDTGTDNPEEEHAAPVEDETTGPPTETMGESIEEEPTTEEEIVIYEEESETVMTNALMDTIPADTQLKIAISGPGQFKESVKNDIAHYNASDKIYTYDMPSELEYEELYQYITTNIVEPVGNIGYLPGEGFTERWYYVDNGSYFSIYSAADIEQAIICNSCLYIYFYSNEVEINLSPAATNGGNVWTVKKGNTLALKASASVITRDQYGYEQRNVAKGLEFSQWEMFYNGGDASEIATLTTSSDQTELSIKAVGQGVVILQNGLYCSGDATHNNYIQGYTAEIHVEADNVPKGTRIPLKIVGPGKFKETLQKDKSLFNEEEYIYTYVTDSDMQYNQILSELAGCVEAAGNLGTFQMLSFSESEWDYNPQKIVSNTSLIDLEKRGLYVYARFSQNGDRYSAALNGKNSGIYRLALGSEAQTLTATPKIRYWNDTTNSYDYVDATMATFKEWTIEYAGMEDDPQHLKAPVELKWNESKPGEAVLTPKNIGKATLIVPIVFRDGSYEYRLNDYNQYTIIVGATDEATLPAGTSLILDIEGSGNYTDTARNDTDHFSPMIETQEYVGRATYTYVPKKEMTLAELESELEKLVEPAGGATFKGFFDNDNQPLEDIDKLLDTEYQIRIVAHFLSEQNIEARITLPDGQQYNGNNRISVRSGELNFNPMITFVEIDSEGQETTISDAKIIWESYPDGYYDNGTEMNLKLSARVSNNPGSVTFLPQKTGEATVTACLITKDGNSFKKEAVSYDGSFFTQDVQTSLPVVIEEHYTKLSYKAYAWDEETDKYVQLTSFVSGNPDRMAAGAKEITLKNAYSKGYRFEGWYTAYDDVTSGFQEADRLSDGRFLNESGKDATLYARFSKIIEPETITVKQADDTELAGTLFLEKGAEKQVEVITTVAPDKASQEAVWSSANSSIAKIVREEGKTYIQGVKAGNTFVTVRSKENADVYKTIRITVVNALTAADSIDIQRIAGGKWVSMKNDTGAYKYEPVVDGEGLTLKLRAVVKSADEKIDATDQSVTWEVEEKAYDTSSVASGEYVTVDEYGTVSIKPVPKKWQAVITATSTSNVSVSQALTLVIEKADYYTVTFVSDKYAKEYKNDGTGETDITVTGAPGEQTIAKNGYVVMPDNPTAEGYTFDGWFEDPERTAWFDFTNTRVTKDVTVYGRWHSKADNAQHTVKLYSPFDWRWDDEKSSYQLVYNDRYNEIQVNDNEPVPTDDVALYLNSWMFTGLFTGFRDHKTGDPVDLSAGVTKDLELDIVYDRFDSVVLTNQYGSGTTIGSGSESVVSLPTGYDWTDDVKVSEVSSYEGKGTVTLTAISPDGRRFSIPVLFVTVTGIKLEKSWSSGSVLGYGAYPWEFSIEPVLSGYKLTKYTYPGGYHYSDDGSGVYTKANAYLHKCFEDGMITLQAPIGLNVERALYQFDSSSPIRLNVSVTGDLTKKKKLSFSCTFTRETGSVQKTSASVTALPMSSCSVFNRYRLYLGESSLQETWDFNANMVYTFGLDEAQEKPLSLYGYFDSFGDYNKTFTVTSSNKKVLTVGKPTWGDGNTKRKTYDGEFVVPLTVKGAGETKITLTAKDTQKASVSFIVRIQTGDATISPASVKLNKMQTAGVSINLNPGYGKKLVNPEIISVTPAKGIAKKVKANADERKGWFVLEEAQTDGGSYQLSIRDSVDVSNIVNGAYTLELADNGTAFKNKLTVNITQSVPTIKIKQSGALNLTAKSGKGSGAVTLSFTQPANAFIKDVTITGSNGELSPYTGEALTGYYYWNSDGTPIERSAYIYAVAVKKSSEDVPVTTKSNKKITLTFDVEGYRKGAITKTVTLKVVNKKPAVRLLSGDMPEGSSVITSVALYPDLGITDTGTMLLSVDGRTLPRMEGMTIELDGALNNYYEIKTIPRGSGYEYDRFVIQKKADADCKAANGKILITHPDYEGTLSVAFKITVPKTNKFKLKLSASTVQLNRNTQVDRCPVSLTSNTTTMPEIAKIELIRGNEEVKDKILASWDEDAYNGTFSLIGWNPANVDVEANNDALKAGTYNLKVKVTLAGGKEYTLPLKLRVVGTALNKTVTVKQSGTLKKSKLNALSLKMTLSGLNGTIEKVKLSGKDANLFSVYSYGNKWSLYTSLSSNRIVTGYAYDVSVESVIVRLPDGSATEVPVNKKLAVKYK